MLSLPPMLLPPALQPLKPVPCLGAGGEEQAAPAVSKCLGVRNTSVLQRQADIWDGPKPAADAGTPPLPQRNHRWRSSSRRQFRVAKCLELGSVGTPPLQQGVSHSCIAKASLQPPA